MIRIGEKIPDFSVDALIDGQIKRIRLYDYLGKWLVLVFYPADFSFVCPTELEDAEKHYGEFKELGAEVFSISTDTAYSHLAWHDTSPSIKSVSYPMIADPTGRMCKEFGTYIEDEGLSLRGTFIIDTEGILRTIEIHSNSIGRNISETLRTLKAAVYVKEHPGEVCPVNWEPGRKSIKPEGSLVGKI